MSDIAQLKQDIVFQAELKGKPLTFHTTWGIFSPREIDSGTWLLLKHLDLKPQETVLDIGCGYGPLGLAIAANTQGEVHMVDKDFVAVEYANKNAELNGLTHAKAYLSNGLSNVPKELKFSTVVSNIPAKVGKEMLSILLHDVHEQLEPGGQFVVVTINGLRQYMKRNFMEVFGNYDKVKQGKDYTISRCVKA
ncbi:Ribosomal RNA large subunit methyltransferase G [Hydrogenovibrio crunogenus]|uniref:Ribosomal RNA large subunit methyltransferase G n=1 Tax=Hydrogenovibrio crunogenus TaxID=39765 RepID=A0A4P7NWW2_9GAMM|nr:methyltransferase [Hydrogenovibrio crunogenus]QBZ82200.1 Ribosomal RNA large subunit methyltransferase G [Hydrogenovibrio crunogenus]